MKDSVYRLQRREFMNDPEVGALVPRFVRTAQDTGAMWAFLKDKSGQWEPRRQFVREEFRAMIDRLEMGTAPADSVISSSLTSFDAAGVSEAWNKALARRTNDPAGAITAARSLLESVCKHIREDKDVNAAYGANDDLPKLYRLVSEQLKRAPSQHIKRFRDGKNHTPKID